MLLGCSQAERRRAAIGAHQPAAAEQGAPEPARNEHHNPVEFLTIDRLENGFARSSARFAVITEPIGLAKAPRPAIVIGLQHAMRGEKGTRGVFIIDRRRDGQKPAALDLLRLRGRAGQDEHAARHTVER